MHAHYANIRYLGLNARIKGTNQAPLRLYGGDSLAVKVRGFIMPVIAIEDGFAVVDASAKADTALAQTPKSPSGSWDYAALDEIAPVIAEPWGVPELAGITFVGTKAEAKTDPKDRHPKAKPAALRVGTSVTKGVTAKPKASRPAETKAEFGMEAAIAYLSSLSSADMGNVIAQLNALKAKPAAAKTPAKKGSVKVGATKR